MLVMKASDFYQAVRLIERLSAQPVGSLDVPTREAVRFRATPSLSFPATQISRLRTGKTGQLEMQVAFLGLFGANGLLPQHYTERLIQRLQMKDTALRDFLDLFNHRMISLHYRGWKKSHFYVGFEEARQSHGPPDTFTQMVSSLAGNPLGRQSASITPLDEVILFYAGYFSSQHRSGWVLKTMLSDYFGVKVEVKLFAGRWLFLEPKARTRLGRDFNQLGEGAMLGVRVWDSQHHLRLCLGPLSYAQFASFLPGGERLSMLTALTRRYIGGGLSFDVQLVLRVDEVVFCQLRCNTPFRLGWNTWLKKEGPCRHSRERGNPGRSARKLSRPCALDSSFHAGMTSSSVILQVRG